MQHTYSSRKGPEDDPFIRQLGSSACSDVYENQLAARLQNERGGANSEVAMRERWLTRWRVRGEHGSMERRPDRVPFMACMGDSSYDGNPDIYVSVQSERAAQSSRPQQYCRTAEFDI